jgi:hypothetical protein
VVNDMAAPYNWLRWIGRRPHRQLGQHRPLRSGELLGDADMKLRFTNLSLVGCLLSKDGFRPLGSALNPANSSLMATALVLIAPGIGAPVGRTADLVTALYLASAIARARQPRCRGRAALPRRTAD